MNRPPQCYRSTMTEVDILVWDEVLVIDPTDAMPGPRDECDLALMRDDHRRCAASRSIVLLG